jgi:CheY-like chemotaxis protein
MGSMKSAPVHLNALVVDDEKELRESLRQSLAAMGHYVAEASSGAEALQISTEKSESISGL